MTSESAITRAAAVGDPMREVAAQAVVDRVAARLFGDVAPAQTIGRFSVLEKLGAGGLGVVYAAYDPQLDRKVAIKLMRTDHLLVDDPRRALREAQALARLAHPNVVAIHDVGPYDGGLFIAMELVAGETLAQWSRGTHGWRERVRVLEGAARGLAAAHAAGIVHRDFKPANVLVGVDGRARVLDFGLAREAAVGELTQPSGVLGLELTQAGTLLGTPAYLAPEQWNAGAVDARTDQWAFCVTAIEVLCGERPFAGEDLAGLRAAVLAGGLHMPPNDARVPAPLVQALVRGLAVDPSRRHADMHALIDVLVHATAPPRRRALQLGVALALVGVGTIAGAAMVTRAPVVTGEIDVEGLTDAARAAAAVGAFVYPPSDDPTAATAYAKVLALEAASGANEDLARARAGELRHELADMLIALGDSYWDRPEGRPFAIDFYATALLFDPQQPHASARAPLSFGELALLRRRAVEGAFSPAELEVGDALRALAEPDEGRRREKLGAVVRARGDALAASTAARLDRLRGASPATATPTPASAPVPTSSPATGSAPREASAQPNAPRSPARAKQLVADGRSALGDGRYADAERAFHQAIAEDPRSARALAGLSDVAFERGRYEDALGYARRAVAIAPKVAAYHLALGDAYFKVLRYADARAAYETARDLGHPEAAAALRRVAARLGG